MGTSNLAFYETPFTDTTAEDGHNKPSIKEFEGISQDVDSPFLSSYKPTSDNENYLLNEEALDLFSMLHDEDFEDTLYSLANEVEETWRTKVSNPLAMHETFIPYATQQAQDYFTPLIRETENMIDSVSKKFESNDLADYSEVDLDDLLAELNSRPQGFSPAQDLFFGKIFKKVKSVVKKGINLAKKGIKAVSKILPINIILRKLKKLIRPLLNKVLKFAIGKLPRNFRPYAKKLASKLMNRETSENFEEEATSDDTSDVESLQIEFDHYTTQIVMSDNEEESEQMLNDYENSLQNLERIAGYDTPGSGLSVDEARITFIEELKKLQPGEDPAPAIEKFLPVAILALRPIIKMALKIIGRQKVINFLAGILSKLVSKYIPRNVARPLAAKIIDVGMRTIGFEVHERENIGLAYEAIAHTIEDTVQNIGQLDDETLNSPDELTIQLLEAFEKAAANNFPPEYLKDSVRTTSKPAVWVAMPRETPVKTFKKFTHIYDVVLDPKTTSRVTGFRSLPLANFLKDKYGLDTQKPIRTRVHLFEIMGNGRLSQISKNQNLPGLNSQQPRSWTQLLPLTKKAASILLKEPSMGSDFGKTMASKYRSAAGKRFYYLEIDGAKLRIPPVTDSVDEHESRRQRRESRSADVQVVVNFLKSEIKCNYFISEEDAIGIIGKLNKGDVLGASQILSKSIRGVANRILYKNFSKKVRVIHEAVPVGYLDESNEQMEHFSLAGIFGKNIKKSITSTVIKQLTKQISSSAYRKVLKYLKSQASEFKQAQAKEDDGVTVKVTWKNIGGMSTIRSLINTIRGKGGSISLSDLSMPSLENASITTVAGKRFD